MRSAMLILCLLAVPVAAHAAEESRIYDAKGHYQGRATTNTANPQQQNFYSPKGEYLGRSMTKDDGSVRFYGPDGSYRGRSSGFSQPKQQKK
ncbi:hypothetical protein [Solidesulfovibrio sp.]